MLSEKIHCPCCGTPNDKYGNCEYCGESIPRPIPKTLLDKTQQPKYIIPFTHEIEDVREELIRTFKTKCEKEGLEIINIEKVYDLMFYFQGRYDVTWRCKIFEDGKDYPSKGSSIGSFNLFASKMSSLSIINTPFPSNAKPFSLLLYDSLANYCDNINEYQVWDVNNSVLQEIGAIESRRKQLSRHYYDFHSYTTAVLNNPAIKVLVACWNIKYKYDGVEYSTIIRDDKTFQLRGPTNFRIFTGFWNFPKPNKQNSNDKSK